MSYDNHIVKTFGKDFNKFISSITGRLSNPTTKFTAELLCGDSMHRVDEKTLVSTGWGSF